MGCKKERHRHKHHHEECRCACCCPEQQPPSCVGPTGPTGPAGEPCDCPPPTCEAYAYAYDSDDDQTVGTNQAIAFTAAGPANQIDPPPDASGDPTAFVVKRAGDYLFLFEVRGSADTGSETPVAQPLVFELTVNGGSQPSTRSASGTNPDATVPDVRQLVGQGIIHLPANSLVRLVNVGPYTVTLDPGENGAKDASLTLKSVKFDDQDCG